MADEPTQSLMVPVDIEAEMRKSYLDYAMSVIIGRALPDVRDGLKPVHRRILYAMYDMGLVHDKKRSKGAGVVGEVLKKYHPHGDVPVYDALVRLAQSFNMRYPLVDGQGNFGSVDGDPPAAMRYTEARLAKIAEEILADIEKETVDFLPNFDETTQEPTVLPTKIPNLLVNGASGIAVGMATNIPPHNLREVIDATVLLIEKPDTSLEEVMKLVPGPDFPTGGYISGREGIEQAYKTGRGSFQMRAKAAIEQIGKDRESIVITEIPYQVNKAKLIERIAELVQTKKLDGIADIRDESDREGMRIVVEVKRGEEPKLILIHLYKHTQMQESFGMILLAIVGGQPRELGLLPLLKLFIEHRVEVVRRRTQFELRKAEEREHILLGFKKALEHLDEVIKLIRRSKSPKEAREGLMETWKFSERQAQAILDLQLHRLTQMEREKITEELKTIQALIAELKEILASEKKLKGVITKELREVQKDYADPRRTEIVESVEEIKLEDLIANVEMAITVSHAGYIKRTPVDVYRHQSRGGKGRIGAKTREEDFVEHLFVASAHSYILLFSSKGRNAGGVYGMDLAKGDYLVGMEPVQPDFEIIMRESKLDTRNLDELENEIIKESLTSLMLTVSEKGFGKRTPLAEYRITSRGGKGVINLKSTDRNGPVVAALQVTEESDVMIITEYGKVIRVHANEIREAGRSTQGVRLLRLEEGDKVAAAASILEEQEVAEEKK